MSFQSSTTLIALELSNSIWLVAHAWQALKKAACTGSARVTPPHYCRFSTAFDHTNRHPNILRQRSFHCGRNHTFVNHCIGRGPMLIPELCILNTIETNCWRGCGGSRVRSRQ